MDLNDLEYVGLNADFQREETMNPNEKTGDIKYYEANEELIIGMEFDSLDEAYSRYKAFAFRSDFGVTKTGRKFTPEGDLKIAIFACSKEGKYRKRNSESIASTSLCQSRFKPTCKTNCKAKMQVKTFRDGK
ncbi:hypothetical protein QJS10_CPB22g00343 [Acorus calamus]|uniref:Protein FAR1-RELATED SEQUENCE n=1 Tax=Acorus calamus TaxID=4465 RepID=A0AAV9C0B3_ACOCL|nr:hypothetical protein QJS10_CPB22g00343 [Acorus calamus]